MGGSGESVNIPLPTRRIMVRGKVVSVPRGQGVNAAVPATPEVPAPPALIETTHAFTLVFPVCNRDSKLLILNLEWMAELDGKQDCPATLFWDPTLDRKVLARIRELGKMAFDPWYEFQCPPPRRAVWPDAPNHMFQTAAKRMRRTNKSWFWYEADAWPLKSGWLPILEAEYVACGQPVMGSLVKALGHINGCAVYPWNFCDMSRLAMSCTNVAWDSASRPDIDGKFHDAGHLMFHAWGIIADRIVDFGSNTPPSFDGERMKQIPETAVFLHRCKDGTLVDQLRKRRQRV